MLNIISKSFFCPYSTGPSKVVKNLIKGLDKIDFPYVINKDPLFGEFVWIHDDVEALKCLQKNKPESRAIIGPNIVISSNEKINYDNLVFLQPSEWVKVFCLKYRFNKSSVEVWPAGIDTDKFITFDEKKDTVIVYFKQRFDFELSLVVLMLKKKNIKYSIITYGSYQEVAYQKGLRRAKYIIWVGRQESQGIALGEALASNIPIIVWDVTCLGHCRLDNSKESKMFIEEELGFQEATAAPFFDKRCGFKVLNFNELEKKIDEMEKNYQSFEPRKHILENLSLEGQAQALLSIFKKYNFSNRYQEKNSPVKNWRNALLWEYFYKAKYFLKFFKRR